MARSSKSAIRYARDGVLFMANFLSTADVEVIRDDVRRLRRGMKTEKGSIAAGRMGCYVDRDSQTGTLLTSASIVTRVSSLVGRPMVPSAYPIELRAYPPGAGMEWHRDDPLYEDPQCELVLCLDNTSDSRTEWLDAQGERHTEWTPPSSALLIRAGPSGAAHRVLPVKTGTRTILKMVWAVPDSARLSSFYEHIDSLPGPHGRRRKTGPSRPRGKNRKRG